MVTLEACLKDVKSRFELRFGHSYVFLLLGRVSCIYRRFVDNCAAAAFTIQWADIFGAIAQENWGIVLVACNAFVVVGYY